MKTKAILLPALAALSFVACDEHRDFPDTAMHVGDVLTTDGDVMRYETFAESGKEAIGVVFSLNNDAGIEGSGYAVYLRDLPEVLFADSLGVSQKTSCSLSAHDGNTNTYSLMSTQGCESQLAGAVFDMWRYGQSAYIPSVAQMRLLFGAKESINEVIRQCGGDVLPDESDSCWYWTSTEVDGQSETKAWLYSLYSGSIQETPKNQLHKARPIITLNY